MTVKKVHVFQKQIGSFPNLPKIRSAGKIRTAGILLAQTGVFDMKEVIRILAVISSAKLKAAAEKEHQQGRNPVETLGIGQLSDGQWVIVMERFQPIYWDRFHPKIRRMNPEWDGNQLLGEVGLFYLVDVCSKLPFAPQQLRYQYKALGERSREIAGLFKQDGTHVVDMAIFAPWIATIWRDVKGLGSAAKPASSAGKRGGASGE